MEFLVSLLAFVTGVAGQAWSELPGAALAFVIFFAAFLPLERLFARHDQPIFRKEYGIDFAFFAGQYLVWAGLVSGALAFVHASLDALPAQTFSFPMLAWRSWIRELPIWIQIPVAVLLGDFIIYWGHRLSHRVAFLWRFHRVHHTAERLDWLAAYREHPLDNLYTRFLENVPVVLLGFSLESAAGLVAFRGVWGLFIHSNVQLPLGPLRFVLGSPQLHHWHHDPEIGARHNFANLMPIMDLIFGTYYGPQGRSPTVYGTGEGEPPSEHGYVSQLIRPLLPRKLLPGRRPAASVDHAAQRLENESGGFPGPTVART